ncbi:hypothetical protein LWI29_001433 [Acer saccharum]|uniref:Uncharacterized protein n=1 Tax=Acer saccharum TaxID=4024 RepID=A0AA39SX09_ACESA|nr:hypothetical protein LWI29_001433 [Acer saccharum]
MANHSQPQSPISVHHQNPHEAANSTHQSSQSSNGEEDVAEVGDELQLEEDEMINEDLVEGDVGPLLMAQPVLVTIDDIPTIEENLTPSRFEEMSHTPVLETIDDNPTFHDNLIQQQQVLNIIFEKSNLKTPGRLEDKSHTAATS